MKRIYTRTGDKGSTAIHGGTRVPKDDIRIEANGCLDELNVAIGIVRSMMPCDHEWQPLLKDIQIQLMAVMSLTATPSSVRESNPNKLPDDLAARTEREIDRITERIADVGYFVLPGGTPLSAQMQQARVVCRRAERRLWTLHRQDPLPDIILAYINRLSDLFFVMARMEMQQCGMEEERWKAFAHRRKP